MYIRGIVQSARKYIHASSLHCLQVEVTYKGNGNHL